MSSYQFQIKQFGWVSTPSFRVQNAQWQQRQANLNDTLSVGSDAADTIASAAANLGSGLNVIAARRAARRLNVPIATNTGTKVNTTA
jgi:hypothetical protein